MKNLNFLSNQSDFGLENGSGMTREWLGIDSTVSRKLFTLLFVLLLGVGQMWGAGAVSISTTAKTFPAGSTSPSANAWKNAGAPDSYPTSATDYTINSNGSWTLYNAADYGNADGLQLKASGGYIQTTISSSAGVDIVVGYKVGNNNIKLTLTGATADVTGSSTSATTASISTTSTSATFKILKEGKGAGYIKYITITPKASSKTLSSIAVQTAPTKVKYVAGENFDPTGLIITRNYSSGSPDTYTYASHTSEFTFSPTTATALTTSDASVSITYGGKSTSQAINVYNVTMQARDEDGNAIPSGGPVAPSRTGKSITPAADANNYVFKQWQVTNASLGSGESTKSNTITNPTEAVTVTAVYYKPITITYKANGQDFTTQTYGYGGTLAFPASEPDGDDYSCTGKTFTGWVAEANKDYKHASTAPTYATAGGSVTTGATYYAVFADASTGASSSKTYSLVLTGNNFVQSYNERSSAATANEVGGSGTFSVSFTSNGVMKSSNSGNPIQFRKSGSGAGVLYNTTDLGTINSITYGSGSTNNIASTYKGSTQQPTSAGTGGYFKITNGSSVSYITSITINFTKTTGSGTTYSNFETTCCQPLVSINGSISWTNGTSATLTWTNDNNVDSYSVTCKQGETNKGTVGSITGTTTKSCTVTELTAGQAYTFTINASGDATHCDASQVISATAPKITATADLDDFGYAQGSNPEEQSFTVSGTALTGNLTVKAPANYLIKVGTGEWSAAGGEKSITVSTPPSDLSSTTIYVKATTGLNEGDNPSGNIRISGGGAANVDVPVSATITSACAVNPTIGAATLKAGGVYSLDGVAVSVTGMNPGTNCTWTDYGFYWGTVDNKKAHKVEIGNSGNATSFEATLAFEAPAQFVAGTTYYFCAYGKNAKSGAEIICGTEASFTPYTVSYNANGGTGEVATVVVNAGGSVTLPNASAFSLDCNDLTKWALNSAGGETKLNPGATYSNITANAEFYAIWNTRTYTISYAAGNTPTNGGNITGSHDDDTKTCGVSLTLPGITFYSTGYTQTGWKKTINGASKTNNLSGSYGVDADQTFYPFWTINTYNVTKGTKTGCNGNDFTLSASSVDHYGSVTVTATPDAAHKGSAHVTVYPSENASVSGTTISNIIGNITVSVSFDAKEAATVKLSVAGSESVVVSAGLEGDSYTLPTEAAECPDLGLYGWYKGEYTHATTAPSGDNYKSKGQTVTLTAGENKFYAVYATVGAPTNTYTKITTTGELESGDYLLVGYFSANFIEAMQNSVSGSSFMTEVNLKEKVNNTTTPTIVTLDSDNSAIRWKITKSPSSITIYNEAISKYFCGSTGTPKLNTTSEDFSYSVDGGNWTLVTNGKTVYYSTNWYVGTPSNAKPIYLFKRNTSLAGPYTTDPNCTTHELSYEDPGTEGTIVLGKSVLGEGKTTTATATPSEHYTFSHWTISGTGAGLSNVDGEGKSTDNPVTVTMGTADAVLTAHFTEKEKCTVEFYNNGGSALSSTTYWLGETPTAPTLTDGHDHDACDENSTAHYGWTQTAWTETLTQEQVDAKTAADVKVYAKAAALPTIAAGDDGKTIKYHAVWANETDNSVSKDYTLSISAGDCPSGYSSSLNDITASEVGGTGTVTVSFGGSGVMNNQSSIQFRSVKNGGSTIYNTEDLGSITGITTNNSSLVYYIGTEQNPSSGTSGGYFRIYNNSDNTIKPSGITINFTKTVGSISYSAFLTTCIPSHAVSSAVSPEDKATVTLGANSVAEGSTTTAEYSNITAGYEFVNWTISGTGASLDDNTANPTTITMGTADVTVTANLQCVKPTFTVHPASKTNYLTTDVATALGYTASAAGASLTQQWQISSNNVDWDDITGEAGTAATYTPNIATAGTKYYRVIVTSACGETATSDPATITSTEPSGYCISVFNSNNDGILSGFNNGGSGSEYRLAFTVPGKDGSSNWPQYWIGENEAWASFSANATIADMKFTSSDGTLGLAEGATGTLHIWDDNKASGSNLHVKFEPSGYGFRWGDHESDDWTAEACTKAFTVDANNANTYWTELVTLDGTNNTAWDYYVGLQTASGYIYSGVDNEASDARGISRTRSVTTMKVSNGTSGQYKATFLNSEATGTTGKFRIWNNNITDYNFVCHFVPFYQLKYNANGGTGTMDPLPATPVSCEESAANRTVTVAANTFTAPTGKQFVKWNTAANGSGADVAEGAYELTGDVTLYAIWADADYTVTVNQSPNASATTTGQTNAAHYGATINLTTTVPDGYEFVNWTSSDVTISDPTSEDGASFTMPAKNVIVTANFQQIYTITWSANGVTTTSTVNAGNKLVLPVSDPTTCNAGYSTFIGWYSVPAGSAEDPSANVSGTKADANHTPTGNEIYYAVWANGELVGGWQKATSIAVGDVVLFVHDVATKKELTGVANNIGTATSYDTELAGSYPLTVMEGSADDSYAFKNGNNYLSYSGSGNNLYTSEDLDAASSWTINASEGGNFQFANANSTTRILQFNNSQYRWACYTGTQQAFQIYKQIASATEFISGCCSEWSAPAISYSTPEHWKAGDDDVAVSIADGDTYGAVSFESSDEAVLTVDAETGAITAVAMGTATITATWAGGVFNAVRYCSASSSVEVAVSGIVTVTFNGNDATSGSMSNQEMYYNEATALSANAFSKTGYTFYGWAETEEKADAGDRDYAGGASVTFTTDKTLYAAWTINKHAVTLNQPTGNTIEATGAANLASVAYGTEITLSATENDGYVFTGWSVTGATVADASEKSTTFSMPDNDVTVTATYSTYEWIAADPRYTVTTDPKIEYYKVEKFSTAGVVIKENFKRSDDNTITKQETYAGAWTAKLDGTPIANGADLSLEDDGKTLKLYIGEDEIASYTLTVNNIDVDQFVVGIWDIEAPSFQINTYTMPTLSNQTAGDAATCKDHNIFIGWTTDPDDPKDANITAGGTEGIVASNTTYYAVWAKQTSGWREHSIKYDWDGTTTGWSKGGSWNADGEGYDGTGKCGYTGGANINLTTISSYAKPKTLSAYVMRTSNNKTNTWTIEYSSNNSTWNTAATKDYNDLTKDEWTLFSVNVSSHTNCYFKIAKNGNAAASVDEVILTYETYDTYNTDYIVDCDTRYEIAFDANGGEGSYETLKRKAGATIELPDGSALSYEYHNFAGWRSLVEYTESVDYVYAAGEEYTVKAEDDWLYAEWTEYSKGTITIDDVPAEYYATQSYTLPTPDAVSGKKFIGWSDGEHIVAPGEYAMPDPAVDIEYTSQWFDLLPTPSSVSFTDGEWILVTAQDQLHAGDFIVVAAANADYAMGAEASGNNNRTPQAVTKSGNTLSYTSDVVPLFLQNGYGANQYALYDMSADKYLYAASSSANQLKIADDFDQNGSWLITIANGSTSVMAQGANTHNDLRYNAGNSVANSVFSCYVEGGQQPIALYRWIETIKTEGNVNASDVVPTYNVNLVVQTNTSIDMNVERTVNDFYIEAMEGESGQITHPENLNINGNAYYDLTLNTSGTMDNSKWYAFAVPFQVDAATGIQRLSNDGKTSNAGFNSHYVLLKYNSEAYASSGQGWEYVTRGETLMPGKFYMIALNSNEYNRVRMTKKAGTPVNNKANLTLSTVGTGEHANWNALANNALAYANVNADGANAGENMKVQVYNSAADSYTAYLFGEVTFTVGTPFFFQAAEEGTMSVDIAATYNEHVKAPARYTATTEEFKLRLGADTESFYDQLYVSASEEAMNEYQIGHDLAKAGVSTTVPQMYVPAYGAKLCDAEFPLVNNEATFPLTFTAPNAGTYQLYISKAATDAELFLTKDGSVIWNLSMGAYALTLEKGTTENYGLLLKAAKTPTGIDDVQSDKVQCTKVVLDDHVYILRGGKMYDVTGKMIK